MMLRILSCFVLLAFLGGALVVLVPDYWSAIIFGVAALVYVVRTETRMEELEDQLEQVEELILGNGGLAK